MALSGREWPVFAGTWAGMAGRQVVYGDGGGHREPLLASGKAGGLVAEMAVAGLRSGPVARLAAELPAAA